MTDSCEKVLQPLDKALEALNRAIVINDRIIAQLGPQEIDGGPKQMSSIDADFFDIAEKRYYERGGE